MALSINNLTKEAISVLILIIVFAIVPKIGLMISTSMEHIGGEPTSEAGKAAAAAWAASPSGSTLWTQMAGIIQIAAVILIVAIIIRAVYQFKNDAH